MLQLFYTRSVACHLRQTLTLKPFCALAEDCSFWIIQRCRDAIPIDWRYKPQRTAGPGFNASKWFPSTVARVWMFCIFQRFTFARRKRCSVQRTQLLWCFAHFEHFFEPQFVESCHPRWSFDTEWHSNLGYQRRVIAVTTNLSSLNPVILWPAIEKHFASTLQLCRNLTVFDRQQRVLESWFRTSSVFLRNVQLIKISETTFTSNVSAVFVLWTTDPTLDPAGVCNPTLVLTDIINKSNIKCSPLLWQKNLFYGTTFLAWLVFSCKDWLTITCLPSTFWFVKRKSLFAHQRFVVTNICW